MKTFKSESDRAEMEDALKHLWVFEQNSLTATDLSVAGALESTRERARVILIRLKEAGLALSKEKTLLFSLALLLALFSPVFGAAAAKACNCCTCDQCECEQCTCVYAMTVVAKAPTY